MTNRQALNIILEAGLNAVCRGCTAECNDDCTYYVAKDVLGDLIKKSEPEKPFVIKDQYRCPKCNNKVGSKNHPDSYCSLCGQKLKTD